MRLAGMVGLFLVVISLISGVRVAFAGDKYLDALRGEVDETAAAAPSSPARPKEKRHERSHSDHHDRDRKPSWSINIGTSNSHDDCDSSNQALGWAVVFGVTSPWWLPHAILESEQEGVAAFPVGPYSQGHEGYLLFDSEVIEAQGIRTKAWGGRLNIDTATNFDGVNTSTGRLRLDSESRFGLDSEWANLVGKQAGGNDWLGRGDLNLVVRFAQSPRAQFHSGIGINWLADQRNADVGFNFTYGVDLFPIEPVVSSSTIDLGKVGDASLIHFRSTLGVMIRPQLQVYTGYDLLNLEGSSIHSLLTGVEFSF